MGQARVKQYNRAQFLKDHPWCVYCGKAADTTDHCPPRCFFVGRVWPEGFEFPACAGCNASNRGDEQIAAVLARASLQDSGPALQEEWNKLCDGVRNNYPDVVAEWRSVGQARKKRFFRKAFGRDVGDALRYGGYGSVHIGPLTTAALRRVALKIGQALFYRHTKTIFEGDIYVHQFDPYAKNLDEIMQRTLKFAPLLEVPERSGLKLHEQFQYRFNVSADHGALNLVVRFGEQLIFQVLALMPTMALELRESIKELPLPTDVFYRFEINSIQRNAIVTAAPRHPTIKSACDPSSCPD